MPTRNPKPIKPSPTADDPEQYRRFVDMARQVEADETLGATDRAFEKVVRPKSSARGDKNQPKN
jgi:hypothetical protein